MKVQQVNNKQSFGSLSFHPRMGKVYEKYPEEFQKLSDVFNRNRKALFAETEDVETTVGCTMRRGKINQVVIVSEPQGESSRVVTLELKKRGGNPDYSDASIAKLRLSKEMIARAAKVLLDVMLLPIRQPAYYKELKFNNITDQNLLEAVRGSVKGSIDCFGTARQRAKYYAKHNQ